MKPIFTNEKAAREHLEALRWPDGPVCPHVGCKGGKVGKVENKKKTYRDGLYYCNACDRTFTVTVGTVFERSKIPLNKWVYAFHLYASSKKGFSAHQLHRTMDITYKSAWFMAMRVREAMRVDDKKPMGSDGGVVEVDETYFGIFKRGMKGIYQHCGESHLHRYLAEFDFRYTNRKITDGERADIALKNAEGKRLMYQGSNPSR